MADYSLTVLQTARDSITKIYLDLEDNQFGSGDKFIEDLHKSFDALKTFPGGFQKVRKEIRRKPMSSFSFSIFYQFSGEEVTIIDLIHQSASPRRWPD